MRGDVARPACGSGASRRAAPNVGVADSLDEAKAAFRAAWERPLSQKDFMGYGQVSLGLDVRRLDDCERAPPSRS